MTSQSSTLLPPSDGTAFSLPTPSGLTPTTRSEAEKAFFQNSLAQTDSAAPDSAYSTVSTSRDHDDEAHMSYHQRRPACPHASSLNYEAALRNAKQECSASSDLASHADVGAAVLAVDADADATMTGEPRVASPPLLAQFPQAGQGVVPRDYGSAVGAGQAEAVKRSRARGLSLGELARQQSWSEQDFKRLGSAGVLGNVGVADRAGYDSAGGEAEKGA